jgi:bifunctional non-homologous end joining protein LigD
MAARRPAADSLESYRTKRDFARTREPSGAAEAAAVGNLFVVHKHAARRLHYDFRIALNGVLKSWAVARGPSLDPGEKRLAVRTEDHPLDYGDFEGTIPKGEYGGGTVMLWDRGTWELETPVRGGAAKALEKGSLTLVLHGRKMTGRWHLTRMKGKTPKEEPWLLIKSDDAAADRADPLLELDRSVKTGRSLQEIAEHAPGHGSAPPAFRAPQLATRVERPPDGRRWLHEMKYDGYRCIAALGGGAVRLYTRNGHDWTARYGDLPERLLPLSTDEALLDGEIVAFDREGRTSFGALQAALEAGGQGLHLFLFDLLRHGARDLTNAPLLERKAALAGLFRGPIAGSARIHYVEHVLGEGERVFDALCDARHEGVVSKKADSRYLPGRRTKTWVKVKCARRDRFTICGWTPGTPADRLRSLVVGARQDDGTLVYRGRVGTGFDARDRETLEDLFRDLASEEMPFARRPADLKGQTVHWLRPDAVCEVAYTEITDQGVLRHPSYLGLREGAAPPARVAPPEGLSDTAAAAETRHGLKLTNPDRILYPDQGVTKLDLVRYYEAVAERMLPLAAGRPLSLVRCPAGRGKHCFFQKHDSGGMPEQLERVEIAEKDGGVEEYLALRDLSSLVAAVQMGVLEFHLWGARRDRPDRPDRLIFDLDPDEALPFAEVRHAALDLRDRLAEAGLQTVPMLTGGKGVHLLAPLQRRGDWAELRETARDFARRMAAEEPERFVATSTKARRRNRIYLDWMRNGRGSTAISPYSTRAKAGATVAAPLTWDELETVERADLYSVADAAHLAKRPDPWAGIGAIRQSLTAAVRRRLRDG